MRAGALEAEPILATLRSRCSVEHYQRVALEIHECIGSTNSHVMAKLEVPEDTIHLCLAEMQTAGRGRRGRSWVSPFGKNIYLSIGLFIKRTLADLGGLSLVSGICVVEVLRRLGIRDLGLKWPNDVLLEGGKLGGLLVELHTPALSKKEADKKNSPGIGVVIGIGINLSLSPEEAGVIGQPWSQLSSQVEVSRNQLAGELVGEILTALEVFAEAGFTPFMHLWHEYNLYAGKEVEVLRGEERLRGIDRGVNDAGNLLLGTKAGVVECQSGEVSLLPFTGRTALREGEGHLPVKIRVSPKL